MGGGASDLGKGWGAPLGALAFGRYAGSGAGGGEAGGAGAAGFWSGTPLLGDVEARMAWTSNECEATTESMADWTEGDIVGAAVVVIGFFLAPLFFFDRGGIAMY
jgi:hypothetical protein